MEPRLRALGWEAQYVGRDTSASPATGSRKVHLREQKELVDAAIAGPAPHLVRAVPSEGKRREMGDWQQEAMIVEQEEVEVKPT